MRAKTPQKGQRGCHGGIPFFFTADVPDALSRVGKMALPLFLERLLNDLGLEALLGIHLLEPSILVFEFLEASHQRDIHAAELAAPFVKRS